MLREQARIFTRLIVAVDVFAISAAFALAFEFRRHFEPPLFSFRDYVWTLLVILPVWLYLLTRYKLFASIRRLTNFEILARLLAVHLWGAFLVAAVIFFLDRQVFSRSFFLLFVLSSLVVLSLEKCSLRFVLGFLRRSGFNFRNLLIVGTREKARRFHELVEEHADWGLRVIGFVQVAPPPLQQGISGHPVLGHVSELVEICKKNTVDEVVFCLPKDYVVDAEYYVKDLEELGITVRMVLDFFDIQRSKKEISFFHNELPILTFHSKAFDSSQLFLKRALDIAGALVGLSITAVLLPFIALAIKLESKGPILFSQDRVGISGRIFKCWKFRSMTVDAETRKHELIARNEMKGAIFKIKNDPRVTRVGKFLRKTSLDELPQFWNVLKGEMSLVGTRPPTPDEVADYENWHRRRICIKPGITGMWQVSGRNRIDDFNEIVRLDLKYIDQWTIWLDLKILLKTVGVVMARRGSC